MDPLAFIRKKSREEWQQLFVDRWTDVRIWIHEHGMQSMFIGLGCGVFVALFFKLVMGTLIVGGLLVFCAWQYALPQVEHDISRSKKQGSGNSPDNPSISSQNGPSPEN